MNNREIGKLIINLTERCEYILKEEIEVNITAKESATTIGYYLSIIEYSKSLGLLVKEGNYISIPHICRSVLEAVIDLLNLSKDSDYYYVLKKISLLGNKKRTKAWRINKKNPLHPNIEDLPENFNDSEKIRNNKMKEIDKIITEKFPKDIIYLKSRFKNAELEELYESVYWLTSPEIHNDISIIWDRHIREEKGKAIFFIKPEEGIKRYTSHINLIIAYLIGGLGEIVEKTQKKSFDKYFFELEMKSRMINKLTTQ